MAKEVAYQTTRRLTSPTYHTHYLKPPLNSDRVILRRSSPTEVPAPSLVARQLYPVTRPPPLYQQRRRSAALSPHDLPPQTYEWWRDNPHKACVIERMVLNYPTDVFLKIYDITQGRAKKFGRPFLGLEVDGIWHTSLLCFGKEHFYCDGIQEMSSWLVEKKFAMTLCDIIYVGTTTVTPHSFSRYLRRKACLFTPEKYDLIEWNCNHFTEMILAKLTRDTPLKYLNVTRLPSEISDQPKLFMSNIRGRTLVWMTKNVLDKVDNFLSNRFAMGLEQLLAKYV